MCVGMLGTRPPPHNNNYRINLRSMFNKFKLFSAINFRQNQRKSLRFSDIIVSEFKTFPKENLSTKMGNIRSEYNRQ